MEKVKGEDPRYYIICPQRKDGGKVAVTVCVRKCAYARRDITFDPADPGQICGWYDFLKGKKR